MKQISVPVHLHALHSLLLLLCICSSWLDHAAAACAGGDPVVTPCPTALAAAEALTGNNAQLPISNAAFSGRCASGVAEGMLLITDFGCHYLAPQMPLGALVLSNGNARIAAATSNMEYAKTLSHGTGSSDPDLAAVSAASAAAGQGLFDEVLLSFDITPTVSGPLAFQYVFGSEEVYSPDAAEQYNDIFGFFIWNSTGPHINVAVLPNTTDPVSILTVNAQRSTYYIANDWIDPILYPDLAAAGKATELNGLTTLLKTADFYVSAGTTYHVKLGIADGFDSNFDSVVWIRAGSVRFNIKDCAGGWVPHTWGPLRGMCTGACEGGEGMLPEVYSVTVAAANGGNACPFVNGTTRLTTPCVNYNPCPVNCTANWQFIGNCTGQCSGGAGFIPEVFNVSSPAMYGGSCPYTNGTTRLTLPCTNSIPCPPRDCVGSWVAGSCSGDCGGGEGLLLEEFKVTVTAAYNGTECPEVNGTTRQEQACNNTTPCPVNCTGSFQVLNNTLCTGRCSGGEGFTPETYIIEQDAMYGGLTCPHSNNTVRLAINCTNEEPCSPVNCTGAWLAAGRCDGPCGGGSGLLPEIFNVTQQAAYGGANCSAAQDEYRLVTSCFNNTPCPIDCVGNWYNFSTCSGACGGGNGTQPERYTVTTPVQWGGAACPLADGVMRSVLECVNDNPCPVPCNYTYIQIGNCTGACGGGSGTLPERFIITDPPLYGGTCPFANGTIRSPAQPCTNNNVCPPVDCIGSFTNSGSCNGTCGGGAGMQKQTFTITTTAAWGGQNCSEAAGTVQYINCTNSACCPLNCVASWVVNGNCTGACSGGSGVLPERCVVTVPRSCGGASCPCNGGNTRSTTPCVNNVPCPPRNCVGSWVARNCSGTCGGGQGLLLEQYVITVTAAYNGTACPELHGTTRSVQACNNTNPCPINCTGTWLVLNPNNCTGVCEGGAGFIPEAFIISQAAMYGGTPCTHTNNTVRNGTSCINYNPCPPVDCVGSWVPDGDCVGGCGGARTGGSRPERYVITTPAARNGTECPAMQGDTRIGTCINGRPCRPVACNATWLASGPCNGSCNNGTGKLPETYFILALPVDGGAACTNANGTQRWTTNCINSTPCPINCNGSWSNWTNCTAACAGGNQTSVFIVTTPARLNGSLCEAANGTVRSQSCNTHPCPIDCNASWLTSGPCNASCNNGTGKLPETYVISTLPAHGGANCTHANGTIRWTINCTNALPCPINCTGSWSNWTNCTAECAGGNQTSVFTVTTPAQHNGTLCEADNGTVRTQPCNTHPCPEDCWGHWSNWTNCSAECATGLTTSFFTVTKVNAFGGRECEAANTTVRNKTCNEQPCPVPCVGDWGPWSECDAACGGGNRTSTFVVTTAGMWGGADCVEPNNTVRIQACNQHQCPVNCQGSYVQAGACTGTCATQGQGVLPEKYLVTIPALAGGQPCPATNGTLRAVTPCVTTGPCPCVGQFSVDGRCMATCSSSGLQLEVFRVTSPATNGGPPCAFTNGTTRLTTCVNSTVCPWADVVLPESPPVLPPLNITLNSTGVVIKGGNVTISGIKIEGASGFTNGSTGGVSSSSFTVGTGNCSADGTGCTSGDSKPTKPRIASFNGTLGFYTIGLLVEVLGEFELQRSMAWTWDTSLSAWTTQVAIRGVFVLTREESVNNVTTSIQTLKPRVSGYLNLWSKPYPGPGFSGRYDWSGKLELAPDPFAVWEDAQSLVTTAGNTSSSSTRHRSLLQDTGTNGNSTSTGMIPVQGRVGVRESKASTSPSGASAPGVLALDDGDITLVCQAGQCPAVLSGVPEQAGNSAAAKPASGQAAPSTPLNIKVIIIAALAAPTGLAVCALGIFAAVMHLRKKREREAAEAGADDPAAKRPHKRSPRRPDPQSEGKQGVKQSWRSTDGGVIWGPRASPATLRRSTNGASCSGSNESTDGEVSPPYGHHDGTLVEGLQPGETGFGSMPGGFYRSGAILPPRTDSLDLYGPPERTTSNVLQGMRGNRWSLTGSMAGMAATMVQVLHLRSSQTGNTYKVAEPHTLHTQGSGGLFSNPLFHPFAFRGSQPGALASPAAQQPAPAASQPAPAAATAHTGMAPARRPWAAAPAGALVSPAVAQPAYAAAMHTGLPAARKAAAAQPLDHFFVEQQQPAPAAAPVHTGLSQARRAAAVAQPQDHFLTQEQANAAAAAAGRAGVLPVRRVASPAMQPLDQLTLQQAYAAATAHTGEAPARRTAAVAQPQDHFLTQQQAYAAAMGHTGALAACRAAAPANAQVSSYFLAQQQQQQQQQQPTPAEANVHTAASPARRVAAPSALPMDQFLTQQQTNATAEMAAAARGLRPAGAGGIGRGRSGRER